MDCVLTTPAVRGGGRQVPHRQRDSLVVVVAGRDDDDGVLFGLFKVLFVLLPDPFPVVLWVLVAVGKSVVELWVVRKAPLGDGSDVVKVLRSGGPKSQRLVRGAVRHGVSERPFVRLGTKQGWGRK